MDRVQSLSKLNAGEGRVRMTAGAVVRGQVRRAALMYGVDFYEEKGWFESAFILRGPARQVMNLKKALETALGDD